MMRRLGMLCLFFAFNAVSLKAWAEPGLLNRFNSIKEDVFEDYKNFYAWDNLTVLGVGLGFGAVLANTSADREIQTVIKTENNDFAALAKTLGGGEVTMPLYFSSILVSEWAADSAWASPLGEWAERSLRSVLVGGPPMLFLQGALGASRPDEGSSHWNPFDDNNAVSGHTFMGAIPFLTAARMNENKILKFLLYAGSTMTGFSRMMDNEHYFSQVALGWLMAYLSSESVAKTENDGLRITPAALRGGGIGLRIAGRF